MSDSRLVRATRPPLFAKLVPDRETPGAGAMADERARHSNMECPDQPDVGNSGRPKSGPFNDSEAWAEAFASFARLGFSGIVSILGFGLWMAWIWFALNGSVPLYPNGMSEVLPPAVALAAFSATMLLGAFSRIAFKFAEKRAAVYLAGGAAGAGCALLAIEALGVVPAGFEYLAILLCGTGAAVLLFAFGLSYSRLEPGPALIAYAGSSLVCFVAYFCLSGIGDFGEDVLFAGLPVLSALCLGADYDNIAKHSLGKPSGTIGADEPGFLKNACSSGLKRLFVASAVFFGAISFTHAMAPIEEHGFAADAAIVATALIECAIVLIYVTRRGTFKILKTCYVASVILFIFANTIAPITGDYHLEYEAFRNAGYFTLFMVVWVLLSWVAGYGETQPRHVFGIAFSAIAAAMAAGWVTGLLIHQAYGETRGAFSIAVGFAVLAFFSFGFNMRDIPKLVVHSKKESETSAATSDGSTQTGTPPNDTDAIIEACRAMALKAAYEHELSPRETEVLGHLVQGYGGERIAEELGISYHTVRAHVRNIYRKLDVHSREELLDSMR